VIGISAIRKSETASQMLKDFANLARWIKWVDDLTSIDYYKIQQFALKKQGKMRDAITKLTASKELLGAVKCGLIDKVEEILMSDVSGSYSKFSRWHFTQRMLAT
jgi:hypothetical protein